MNQYIVRVWVDLKIKAVDNIEAKKIANDVPINVTETGKVEVYDTQIGQIWLKGE